MYGIHSGLKLAVTASMLLWASMAVTPATAGPVTFNFSGAVTSGDSGLFAALSPSLNPTVSGYITYESSSTTPVPVTLPTTFSNAITNVSFTIGTYTATLVPPVGPAANEITVSPNTFLGPSFNNYHMTASIGDAPHPLGGAPTGPFFPFDIELDFIHGPGVFGNNNVPSLGGVLSPTIRLTFQKGTTFPYVTGPVALTAVPLPSAVILFGAGFVALVGLGARNWRKQENGAA